MSRLRGPFWMANEGDVPAGFGPKVRWTLTVFAWILLLIVAEQAWEGHYLGAAAAFGVYVADLVLLSWWGKVGRRHMAWMLITAGGVCLVVGIWLLAHTPTAAGSAPIASTETPVFRRTILRLQFFGDERFPQEITADNIKRWFSYRSGMMGMTPQDKDGKPTEGGFFVPPSWAIFIIFEKPSRYRQIIPSFSNPATMPTVEVHQ